MQKELSDWARPSQEGRQAVPGLETPVMTTGMRAKCDGAQLWHESSLYGGGVGVRGVASFLATLSSKWLTRKVFFL